MSAHLHQGAQVSPSIPEVQAVRLGACERMSYLAGPPKSLTAGTETETPYVYIPVPRQAPEAQESRTIISRMSATRLPGRKPASREAKLQTDLQAPKPWRPPGLGFSRASKQLPSTLPATATAVSAADQRAGLHTQEDKADLYCGQGSPGKQASEQVPHRKTSRTKGLEMQQKQETWLYLD